MAFHDARIQVGITVIGEFPLSDRADARELIILDLVRIGIGVAHGGVADVAGAVAVAVFDARQQVNQRMVGLADQADGVRLLDLPEVQREGQAIKRLPHEADGRIRGFLGHQCS